MVAAGRLRVNGEPATPGARVVPGDRVTLDGRRLTLARAFDRAPEVLAYHKPAGVICTRADPSGRPTIFADLPRSRRWISVGRLDLNSSGLLLITNDGGLANRLMHPRYGVEREYLVRVRGELGRDELEALADGVEIDGRPAAVESVSLVRGSGRDDDPERGPGHGWYRIVISEGRNREVRRLFEAVGHPVARLKRIRYGPVTLDRSLRPGKFRTLNADEVGALAAVQDKAAERIADAPQRLAREGPAPKRARGPRQRRR